MEINEFIDFAVIVGVMVVGLLIMLVVSND